MFDPNRLNPICPVCKSSLRLGALMQNEGCCPICGKQLPTPGYPLGPVSWGIAPDIKDLVLLELLVPSQNTTDVPSVIQFFSSLITPVLFGYSGDANAVRMYVGVKSQDVVHIRQKVQATWAGTDLKALSGNQLFSSSWASPFSGRVQQGFVARRKRDAYLPFAIYSTLREGDPVYQLLAAFQGLGQTEEVSLNFQINEQGSPEWVRTTQSQLKVEKQRNFVVSRNAFEENGRVEINPTEAMTKRQMFNGCSTILLVCFTLIVTFSVLLKSWGQTAILLGLGTLGLIAGYMVQNWLLPQSENDWQSADHYIVGKKVLEQNVFYKTYITGWISAASEERAEELLHQVRSALSAFSFAGGNEFDICWLSDIAMPDQLSRTNTGDQPHELWLGPGELSGLWHAPYNSGSALPPYLKVNRVVSRVPDLSEFNSGFAIGAIKLPDGTQKPVTVGNNVFSNNTFVIGKTGMGKSSLLVHLLLESAMSEQYSVVVIDPHNDLADQIIGSLPPEYISRVVIMDVGAKDFITTINLIDSEWLHRDPQFVLQQIIDLGKAIWPEFWGPRMEVPLKFALKALIAINQVAEPGQKLGLSMIYPLLTANPLELDRFLELEMPEGQEKKEVLKYFREEFFELTKSFQEQVVSPVLSKALRWMEEPMLPVFSCPKSSLDLKEIIEERKILVIKTRSDLLGNDLADFVGSWLINLLQHEIIRQGQKLPQLRVPVMFTIDEFQVFSGVNYGDLLGQLRKYGGHFTLATQSLANIRLRMNQEMPGVIFGGSATTIVFQTNGEDAKYIAENEFSTHTGGPTPDTLANLDPYTAFIRMNNDSHHPVQPFAFHTSKPPVYRTANYEQALAEKLVYGIPYDQALESARHQMNKLDWYLFGPSSSQAPSVGHEDDPNTSLITNQRNQTRDADPGEDWDLLQSSDDD